MLLCWSMLRGELGVKQSGKWFGEFSCLGWGWGCVIDWLPLQCCAQQQKEDSELTLCITSWWHVQLFVYPEDYGHLVLSDLQGMLLCGAKCLAFSLASRYSSLIFSVKWEKTYRLTLQWPWGFSWHLLLWGKANNDWALAVSQGNGSVSILKDMKMWFFVDILTWKSK